MCQSSFGVVACGCSSIPPPLQPTTRPLFMVQRVHHRDGIQIGKWPLAWSPPAHFVWGTRARWLEEVQDKGNTIRCWLTTLCDNSPSLHPQVLLRGKWGKHLIVSYPLVRTKAVLNDWPNIARESIDVTEEGVWINKWQQVHVDFGLQTNAWCSRPHPIVWETALLCERSELSRIRSHPRAFGCHNKMPKGGYSDWAWDG